MYLVCKGPGPHTPSTGIIGEAANNLSQPWCGECVARLLATPPDDSPVITRLDQVVERLDVLTDAVEQLIINELMGL